MAHSDAKTLVSVPHSTVFDHEKVKNQLGVASEAFGSFMEMAKVLQTKQINTAKAHKFLENLIAPLNQVKKEEYDITKNRTYQKILALFDGDGKGSELVGHTKWGMLNAVTEYYDHYKEYQERTDKLEAIWIGSGAKLKEKAFSSAVALL
jgi:hypothetical protein